MIKVNNPQPLAEAVAKISSKTPLGAALKSEDWANMPLAIRERAQFSSTVVSMRVLQLIQDKLRDSISLQREKVANGEALVDRSSFIGDIRSLVLAEGISPDTPGLESLASRERLGLIFDTQTQQAENYARWKMDQDPDVLDEFPAQRLIRYEKRKEPRDWRARWVEAGNKVNWEGALRTPMIALKNSPIWRTLSYFGTPWPPYDFNSGMGLEDIDRGEAESLGLIGPDDTLEPEEMDFNAELQASVENLSPEMQRQLKKVFGDQLEITDGKAVFKGDKPKSPKPNKPNEAEVPLQNEKPFSPKQFTKIEKHLNKFISTGDARTGFRKYLDSLKVKNPRKQSSIIKSIGTSFTPIQKQMIKEGIQEVLDILPKGLADQYKQVKILKNKKSDRNRGSYSFKKLEIRMRPTGGDISLKEFKATVKHEFMHHLHVTGPDEYVKLISDHYKERTKYIPTRPGSYPQIKEDDFIKGYKNGVPYYAGTIYGFEKEGTNTAFPKLKGGSGLEIPTVYFQNLEFLDEDNVLSGYLNDKETFIKVMSIFYYGRNINE